MSKGRALRGTAQLQIPEEDVSTPQRVSAMRQGPLSASAFCNTTHKILVAYCLAAGLSIALSQILVVAVVVYWLAFVLSNPIEQNDDTSVIARFRVALITWLAAALLASVVGIDFANAFPEFCKTALYLLFPFAVYASCTTKTGEASEIQPRARIYILCLMLSLSIAGLHTVFSAVVGQELAPKIPGPVTESGQLVLIIPCGIALLFSLLQRGDSPTKHEGSAPNTRTYLFLALAVFFMILAAAWADAFPTALRLTIPSLTAIALAVALAPHAKNLLSGDTTLLRPDRKEFQILLCLTASFLFASLLVNLKRGPWLGVLAELVLLGALISRRLLAATIVGAGSVLLFLEPARERLTSLVDHFFIHGGRSSMWTLGAELVGRFPLGLGLDNARFMRTLDPTLPYLHRHMHNNLLNIAVETGWIGLAAYIWWMCIAIVIGFLAWRALRSSRQAVTRETALLALGLSLGLIGWQVSGLVEYNFGDGEVRLIAFFYMGLLLSFAKGITSSESKS